MKRFKLHIILGLAVALAFPSCLDFDPKTQLADTNYWQTPDQFKLFATQFYGWTRDFKQLGGSAHSDDHSDLQTAEAKDEVSNGTNSIPSSDKNYTDNYNRIRQTNILLEKAGEYSTQEDIAVYVGEAKFFRAYCYFDLVQIYGDVIIVDKPLDVNDPKMQQARDQRGDVIDFIIKDLQEAAEVLPAFNEIASADEGRVSSEAAYAFLSRVALYEGTWQKFHVGGGQNTERSRQLLDIAAKAANEVIISGTFELFKPADLGIWAYKYLFILENEKSNPAGLTKSANREYILSRRHDQVFEPIGFNITEGRLGNALYVTRKMANMYLRSNGLPVDPTTWDYSDMDSEFKDRDNRMQNTMMIPGRYYWSNGGGRVDWSGALDQAQASEAELNNAAFKKFPVSKGTGYFPQKWCTERDGVQSGSEGYDYPVIRYAEVLLNYAEAVFERDDNIEDSDLAKSLNLVRKRVNPDMPDLTKDFVDSNGLKMRTEIRRERTVELFDEGFRLDDLKRWKTAETEMPMNLVGVKYEGTEYELEWPGGAEKQKDAEGCILHESGRVWAQKNYLYPLPVDQLQLNPNLKQNPGWDE